MRHYFHIAFQPINYKWPRRLQQTSQRALWIFKNLSPFYEDSAVGLLSSSSERVPCASWETPTLYSCPSCQVLLPVPLRTPAAFPTSIRAGGASKLRLPWECTSTTGPRRQQPQGYTQLSFSPFWTFLTKQRYCSDYRVNYKRSTYLYPLLHTWYGNGSKALSLDIYLLCILCAW